MCDSVQSCLLRFCMLNARNDLIWQVTDWWYANRLLDAWSYILSPGHDSTRTGQDFWAKHSPICPPLQSSSPEIAQVQRRRQNKNGLPRWGRHKHHQLRRYCKCMLLRPTTTGGARVWRDLRCAGKLRTSGRFEAGDMTAMASFRVDLASAQGAGWDARWRRDVAVPRKRKGWNWTLMAWHCPIESSESIYPEQCTSTILPHLYSHHIEPQLVTMVLGLLELQMLLSNLKAAELSLCQLRWILM